MAKVTATVDPKRAVLVIATLIIMQLISIAFPGCTTQKAELPHLKVAVLPYIGFATFYISQEEGYYAQQGIDVELVKFTTASEAIPLLAQGSLDVARGEGAGIINAVGSNMRLRIVAGASYLPTDCESITLLARSDLYQSGELDTVVEIKGKKVASGSKGSTADFALTKILEAHGLRLNDVELVNMAPKNMIAALENRAVDAVIVGSPNNEQIKALGYARDIESAENVIPGFQQGLIMFGPNLLDDKPELGKKFMLAYLQGCRQYNEGKTQRNMEIIEQYTGLDKDTLLQSCWTPVFNDGRIKSEDVSIFQDWAYENGFVDKKVSLEQLIDTRFIDYANKVLGPAR